VEHSVHSYAFDDPAKNQKRTLAFVLVVAIHAMFIWVINSGLVKSIVEFVAPPVETEILDEGGEGRHRATRPCAPRSCRHPTSDRTGDVDRRPRSRRPNDRRAAPPQPTLSLGQDATSTQGKGARITQPEYPPASRRAGEEGTVNLQVYVLETGRAGEIKIAKSSGFPKLDEAAVKEVQRNWRFVPGKEDGKPVPMWHIFAVTLPMTTAAATVGRAEHASFRGRDPRARA
jgi:protein TonB